MMSPRLKHVLRSDALPYLGGALLVCLLILVMTGVTLRENTRMIDLSRSLGFETRSDPEDPDLVQMTLVL